MTYQETLQYLYDCAPMFQNIGVGAYKPGLDNTMALDRHHGHPHHSYKTIHVAGTNGKGSVSHTLAAILQNAGYNTGLYTSPHLVDFAERIRVNGQPISHDYVVDFVERHRNFFEPLSPSFFEVTTAMALQYFKDMKVDVAVIETGLGGRLDCTNIISPVLSVITNISLDHTQLLGHTLSEIAREKAGIIKPGVPVIIGETQTETAPVFITKARETRSPICFADEQPEVTAAEREPGSGHTVYHTLSFGQLRGQLTGLCQERNTNTILRAVPLLREAGFDITSQHITQGFATVCDTTGLMGRWQKVNDKPLAICDTGHNEGAFSYICPQIESQTRHQRTLDANATVRIVFGMVDDKDLDTVLGMLPKDATYYFTKASVRRSTNERRVCEAARSHGLSGHTYPTVSEAYKTALAEADDHDLIFVGGSGYVVADLLAAIG